MAEKLTHWKKLDNYNYFGAYLMPTDGTEVVLTIKEVKYEEVKGSDGKSDHCRICYFIEPVKPLILNSTNSRSIQKVAGSPYVEKWAGVKIQLYVAQVRAFGDVTEAIRVRDFAPKDETIDPANAIARLKNCTTLIDLQKVYLALSKAEQAHTEVIKIKDTLKGKLK